MTTEGRSCARLVAAGKLALLLGLLALHFAARWHYAQTMPLAERHNYERSYVYSLSLVAGRGFHDLVVGDTPEAAPVLRFLDMQADRVTPEQFTAYLANPGSTDVNSDFGGHNRWVSSRLLDHYVVAGLWRLFGIRWDVVFLFGVTLSTLTCLFIFLLGRRLGGGYGAGLAAAVLFFAAPLTSYLETWSYRDASPLWFAAAGFWFLFCVLDRPARAGWRLAGCLALGILAMIGVGWRPDVFLSVAWLGLALPILSWRRGIPLRQIALGLALYGVGAWSCHAAVHSLTSEQTVDSQNGFHMAVYADFSRANLLEIENSFQIERCDRETMFVARQWEQAHDPAAGPLPFIGARYSRVCRSMFLDELSYNAFRFTSKFPLVYWKSLNGLMIPGAFATLDNEQLRQGRLPRLSWLYKMVLDPVSSWLPWLFFLGLLVATTTGPARMQSAILAGFSLLQVAALLLVLPEQKHLATLALPLCVLGGVGVWSVVSWLCPANFRRAVAAIRRRRLSAATPADPGTYVPGSLTYPRRKSLKIALTSAAALVALWGIACFASYEVSKHERQKLIDAIHDVAKTGTPAPETIHGDRAFSVQLLPGSPLDSTGYLLKIAAGPQPGTLLCRHIHFPQDWCWPRVLETTHRLQAGREQYFFLSCLQGARFGDPRPYSCSVSLDGDARIESCLRVDLKDWDRLQVSTVFSDEQTSPGSPRAIPGNSVMRWADWPAIRSLTADERALQELGKAAEYVGPPPIAPPSQPIQHLIARDKVSGAWWIAISDGRKFQPHELSYWAPHEWSALASGDFDGNGLTDLLGQVTDGVWWLGRANGNFIEFKPCPLTLPNEKFDYVGVGDFNGDGADDVAARSAADGRWWIGLSDGQQFSFHAWASWTIAVPPENVRIGEFGGNHRSAIAGLDPRTGQWIVSQFEGGQLTSHVWGTFDSGSDLRHIVAADFNGDGRTDVAAWNSATGQWQLGRSEGDHFACQAAGSWRVSADWRHVQPGHFSGDARQGIIGLDKKSGRLAIAQFDGKQFTTRQFPSHPALDEGILVGNFAGGDRDNLAGITKSNEIWVGTLTDTSIHFAKWADWPGAENLDDRRVMSVWR